MDFIGKAEQHLFLTHPFLNFQVAKSMDYFYNIYSAIGYNLPEY